jgi:hypothetical protein
VPATTFEEIAQCPFSEASEKGHYFCVYLNVQTDHENDSLSDSFNSYCPALAMGLFQ